MEQNTEQRLIINEDIHVIEWCPDVFAYLRELDGLDKDIDGKSVLQ